MDNKNKYGCDENSRPCFNMTEQHADVSLSIKATPYAVVGQAETICCGESTVNVYQRSECDCCCELVITQPICIKIPIRYGADIQQGEVEVSCRYKSK